MTEFPLILEEEGWHLKQLCADCVWSAVFGARRHRALVLENERLLIKMFSYLPNPSPLTANATWEPLHLTASQRPKEELTMLQVQRIFINLGCPGWNTGGQASKSVFPVNAAWDRLFRGGGM